METSNRIYTLAEAAARLRLTNRGLAKIARQHGLCMATGRKLLFTDRDLEAILDTLRVEPTSPKSASIKPALSEYQTRKSLLELTRKKGKSVSPKARAMVLSRSGRK